MAIKTLKLFLILDHRSGKQIKYNSKEKVFFPEASFKTCYRVEIMALIAIHQYMTKYMNVL